MVRSPFRSGPLWALVLVLALVLGGGVGCGKDLREEWQAKATERKARFEEKILRDRAEEYWEAFRWRNWQAAAALIEDSGQRVRFLRERTSLESSYPKIDELSILYIFVDPKTALTGEVRVQWNEVLPTVAHVVPVVQSQSWYRKSGRWWVNFEDVPGDLPVVNQPVDGAPQNEPADPAAGGEGAKADDDPADTASAATEAAEAPTSPEPSP